MLRPQGLRAVFGRHGGKNMTISISDFCLYRSPFFCIFAQLLHTVSNKTCIHAMQHTLQELITLLRTLLHTTPLCTTLHHTAPHCNTLHHTAPHYNTLQHTAAIVPFKHMSMLCSISLKISNVFGFNIECEFDLYAVIFNE